MWLNHKKLSISNLEAKLKILLCFSVNEQLVVSWQLQFSLDEIKCIFLILRLEREQEVWQEVGSV